MKLKKMVSLALAAALTVSLGLGGAPALAAGADDAALQSVTLKVKDLLGLDTELYTDFSGTSSEDALTGRRWTLEWSGDGISLSIRADDAGKIYSYTKNSSLPEAVEPVFYGGSRFNIPKLPTGDSSLALKAAQGFLDRVLTPDLETAELTDDSQASLRQSQFRFSTGILLNGEPSPIECSVTVRASDNEVIRFWRSDEHSGYAGTIPSPNTQVSEAQARRNLRSTLELSAYYVRDEGSATAQVRYVPQSIDDFYVDGKTGELVNLTELRQKLWSQDDSFDRLYNSSLKADMVAPEESMGGATLSPAEIEGAAKLAGAMDKEALDKAVQNAWPEIGLDKYTLASATYSVEELDPVGDAEKGETSVKCRLVYGLKLGDAVARKYVTVDAKTGELLSLSGYRPYQEGTRPTVLYGNALTAANKILESFAGKHFSHLELYNPATPNDFDDKTTQYSFVYAQKEHGYFFPENQYYVTVDAVDGTISQLVRGYDDTVELIDPQTVITPAQATEIYEAALELRYGYLAVPISIDLTEPEIYARLKDSLYSYVNTLKPGFVLEQPDRRVYGVYAATGEVAQAPEAAPIETGVSYDDVAGTWIEKAANTLAKYGVGFVGGSLRRTDELTQVDMIALLCTLDGYQVDVSTAGKEEIDYLYQHAYMLGLVTPETRDEDKTITRGELVKLILDSDGYGKIAALSGIFRCGFSDADAIPEADYGYAALAQGLGLVRGGSDKAYAAGRTANRGEAIAMLYQYMK